MATKTTKIRQEIEEQAATGDLADPKTKMATLLANRSVRRVEYDGVEYQIDSGLLDDIEVIELLEDEKYISAIRKLVGADGWKAFKDSHREADGRVPMGTLEGFLNVVMKTADPQGAS